MAIAAALIVAAALLVAAGMIGRALVHLASTITALIAVMPVETGVVPTPPPDLGERGSVESWLDVDTPLDPDDRAAKVKAPTL